MAHSSEQWDRGWFDSQEVRTAEVAAALKKKRQIDRNTIISTRLLATAGP